MKPIVICRILCNLVGLLIIIMCRCDMKSINALICIHLFFRVSILEVYVFILCMVRLGPMDYRMMSLEWEGFSTEHLAKLKEETASLIAKATVTEQLSSSKADYALRNKQKYGRIYIDNSVQSYEFVVATFGGAPPLGKLPILIPDSVIGCESMNESQPNPNLNYERKVVVVRRGECSFLTKALNAKKFNASALIIVNTEDILEPPASGWLLLLPTKVIYLLTCQVFQATVSIKM